MKKQRQNENEVIESHNIKNPIKQELTELTIQGLEDEKEKLRKGLYQGVCIECNKPLSRTEFRDSEGELEGWIVECVFCGLVYEER